MEKDFTIFLTFICNDDLRRAYIKIAIKTLLAHCQNVDVPFLIIDGSNESECLKNKAIFKKINNIDYIIDDDPNPFKRCIRYFDLVRTDFVLRLLEDAAFINFSRDDFSSIKKDIEILKSQPKIDVVHYLMVDDNAYSFRDNILLYEPLSFKNKSIKKFHGWASYSHAQNGYIYHYLCNNVLYRRDLFLKQWNYLAENYLTHNDAEAGNINRIVHNKLSNIKYIGSISRLYHRLFEKFFKKNSIIKSAIITQTSLDCDALHIGYCRVEMQSSKYDSSNSIELYNLAMFNDLSTLPILEFRRRPA